VRFTVDIELGNEGMSKRSDVSDALAVLRRRITVGGELNVGESHRIKDANGNTVGWAAVVA
jgi:hypothetical protein